MATRTNFNVSNPSLLDDSLGTEYLRAIDIPIEGKKVKIDHVTEQFISKDQKPKKVVYFQNESKALVLNLTNEASINKVANDTNYGNLKNCEIELYRTSIEWNEVETPCIRVRLTVSKIK